MQLQIWRLKGRYFHFGERGLGQEETRVVWPSDSLFSALIARLSLLRGAAAVEQWMKPFLDGSPPFLLSSLYPYAGEVRFFPTPMGALRPDGQSLPGSLRPKNLKKVQFVSQGLYSRLTQGASLASQYPNVVELHHGGVWLHKDEVKDLPNGLRSDKQASIWEIEKRPRVSVGRDRSSSQLFHVGAIHFAPHCGLWFGVQWLMTDSVIQNLFKLLLEDLGDAGLGAERSTGYGKAMFEKSDMLELPDPHPGGMWTTLSRYLPRPEETSALQYEKAAYRIETLSGWLDSPQKSGQRRRSLNLLAEGATLGPIPDALGPYGMIEEVHPIYLIDEKHQNPVGHAVYRSGLALAVGYGGKA